MHKIIFSKITGLAVVLSFILSLNVVRMASADTKTTKNPDGTTTIKTSSGYEWTVDKDGKTVSGKRPGGDNNKGNLTPYQDKADKEAAESRERFKKAQEQAKRDAEERRKKLAEAQEKAKKEKEKLKVKKNKKGEVVGVEGPSVKDGVTNYMRQVEGHEVAKREAPVPNAQDTTQETEKTNTEDRKTSQNTTTTTPANTGGTGGTTPR